MKLLLVNTLYTPFKVGGAERSVQSLAEGLVQRGHSVTVATLHPGGDDTVATIGGVEVHSMRFRNVYWPYDRSKPALLKPAYHALDTFNPVMGSLIGRLVERLKPDLVHTNNLGGFSPSVWMHVARSGTPLVHTARDYHMMCPRTHMFRRGTNCVTQCVSCRVFAEPRRWLSRHVNAFVALSPFVLKRYRDAGYFAAARESVVIGSGYSAPNGAAAARGPVRPPVRFGYAGRLTPEKGIEVLVRAAATMDPALAQFTIAGTGERGYEDRLRAEFASTGSVRFVGPVKVEELLTDIDVMVAPSLWHEPFGRTAVEAMAHGVPVLASNRGGLADLVTHGSTGWLFDPEDQTALRGVLKSIADHPSALEGMRAACVSSVSRLHPDVIAEQYEGVFARAVRNATQRSFRATRQGP